MTKSRPVIQTVDVFPLTPERWDDFETLFGKNGACAGCWCMWWRMTHKEFNGSGSEGHKEALRTLVHRGVEPGLIAYADGVPAGWVAVAPREDFIRLKTSEIFAPVDDQPVWSIPCFYINRKYRKQGMTTWLINAAVEFAKSNGAQIVEAYTTEPEKVSNPLSIYTGVTSTFKAAGFVEVARRKPNKPVMRKTL